jgi:hypothetical protein
MFVPWTDSFRETEAGMIGARSQQKEMDIIVKACTIFSAVFPLILFSGICFSQPAVSFDSDAVESDISTQASEVQQLLHSGQATASPGELYPAVVATVNGIQISGRDLELHVRRELNAIGNPEWKNLREEYKQQLTVSGLAS